MKLKRVNTFPTKLPSKSAFMIETEYDYPKLHTLCIASGKRGGGKSVAVANFVANCKNKGYYDRVYLITPTYQSNKSIWDIASIEPEDIYEPTVDVLKIIIQNIEDEKKEYEEYLEKKAKYKRFVKDMKYKNIHSIEANAMLYYYDKDFFNGPPKWKYKDDSHPPRLAVIMDDSIGSDLMSKRSSKLLRFLIAHRHWGEGVGISVFMLVQAYCCSENLPRAGRENCTHLMLLRLNNEEQLKKLKDECDLPVTDEEFDDMCKYAHSIPFNFLFLDFAPKCEKRRFRSGFNDYIIPKSLENVPCDCEKCNPSKNNKK